MVWIITENTDAKNEFISCVFSRQQADAIINTLLSSDKLFSSGHRIYMIQPVEENNGGFPHYLPEEIFYS